MRAKCVSLVVSLLAGLLFLAGCQSTTPPPDDGGPDDVDTNGTNPEILGYTAPQTVQARVQPPAGAGWDTSTLVIPTIVADAAVGANGAASPQVISDFPSLLRVHDAAGNLVLLGFVTAGGGEQTIGARSTAQALLFLALGGFTLPADGYAQLLALLDAAPETGTLASAIESALAADPAALMAEEGPVVDAMRAARAALAEESAKRLPGEGLRGGPGPEAALPARKTMQGSPASDFQIFLSPDANSPQSGVQIVHNPDGSGIVAINNFRRRASVYAYLVGTKDAEGVLHEESPPRQVGAVVEVEATSRLGLLPAIGQALSGDAPWAPVQSAPLDLPREGEAVQTLYAVAVLGPAIDAEDAPLFADSRFGGFIGDWTAKVDELWLETAVYDFLVPLLEQIGVGAAAYAPVRARAATLAEFKLTLDPVLLARGLPLRLTTPADIRNLVAGIIAEMGENSIFSQRMINLLQKVVLSASGSQADLSRLQGSLANARSFGAILAAVNAAMAALDAGAVLHDLTEARAAEGWDAVVIERRVRLDPSNVVLTPAEPSVVFTATVNGLPDEDFVYRWTTTGERGRIFSPLDGEGTEVVTGDDEIQYIVDITQLVPGRLDTVSVEVFLDDGSGQVPAGAASLGSATAVVRGPVCASPDDLVNIPYETLRNHIAQLLGVSGDAITCGAMETLTELNLSGYVNYGSQQPEPLEGLQYAINLQSFSCNFCLIQDAAQFDLLRDLTELRRVDLSRTGIGFNIAALAQLVKLQELYLSETNSLTDLSPLSGLTNLEVVDIHATNVTSLNGLQGATRLERLDARAARIGDIAAIRGATKLTYLDLYTNNLADIGPLANMPDLEILDLGGSGTFADISALANKPKLRRLELSHGPGRIDDLAPLAASVGLEYLALVGQKVRDLSPLANMTKLGYLDLQGNEVTDIGPLAGLTSLTQLDLTGNGGLTSIAALSSASSLQFLSINDTAVASVEPLVDAGVGQALSLNMSCTPALQLDTENIELLRDRGVFIPQSGGNCD